MPDQLVFLDRDTTDRGDLDFSGIESLGDLISYPTSARNEIAGRIAGAVPARDIKTGKFRGFAGQQSFLNLLGDTQGIFQSNFFEMLFNKTSALERYSGLGGKSTGQSRYRCQYRS